MRKLFLLSTLLAIASCTVQMPVEPESEVREQNSTAIIPGELEVEFSEEMIARLEAGFKAGSLETKSPGLNSAFSSLGVYSVERIFPDAGEWEPRHRKAGLHRWYRIKYNPEVIATKAANDFYGVPGVDYAEPCRKIKLTGFFDDPMADKQWALYNDGQPSSTHSAGYDVNVYPVWERFSTGSSDVIVAVLDEGVQLDHPDLRQCTIPGGTDGSKSFVDGYVGYNIIQGDHGTHCAGVIAASNDNGLGINGIAGGSKGKPGVRIMSCVILMDDPNEPGKTLNGSSYDGMVWAADHGAIISSNSWTYVYESETDASRGRVGSMGAAIDYFIEYAGCDKETGNQRPDSPMKGGVVIFAAGNDGWQHAWPSMYDKVIAVGAIGSKGSRAYYSNFGDWVDICAPGGDAKVGPQILSCVSGSKYGNMQGTSMACPHVSGVAALIVSHFGGPGFTNEMLVERLLKGASTKKAPYLGKVGPLVDAMGSFTYDSTVAPDPADAVKCSATSNYITCTWKVTADRDDVKTYGYRVFVSSDRSDFESLDPAVVPQGLRYSDVEVLRVPVGEDISVTLDDLGFETDYYLAVAAYDYAGNFSALSGISEIRTGVNSAPVITLPSDLALTYKAFEKRTFEISISEPDNHEFKVSTDSDSDAFSSWFSNNVLHCTIDALKAEYGTHTVVITATDKYGLAATYKLTYEVLANHAPEVIGSVENIFFSAIGASKEKSLAELFRDADGETLDYNYSNSVAGVAHLYPTEGIVRISATGFGLTESTITATDARGESAVVRFRIFVQNPGRAVDIYPNPVKTQLNIRPASEGQLEVTITNKIGAVVYYGKSDVSPFYPLEINVKDFVPGSYSVRINGAGIDGSYTIVKI